MHDIVIFPKWALFWMYYLVTRISVILFIYLFISYFKCIFPSHLFNLCKRTDLVCLCRMSIRMIFWNWVLELQYNPCDDQWICQYWFPVLEDPAYSFFAFPLHWKYTIIAINFIDWLCYTQKLFLVYVVNKQMKTWQNMTHLKEKYCVPLLQLIFSCFGHNTARGILVSWLGNVKGANWSGSMEF